MDRSIIAIIIQEGSKVVSEILRNRPLKHKELQAPSLTGISETPGAEEKQVEDSSGQNTEENIKEGTACLPCTNSHLHACVGLLNEATRMSRDGLTADTMNRVDNCLGEIVAAERIDLTPANIAHLPADEKKIAEYASKELREIRHDLEGLSSPKELENIAARTSELQKHIGREWFRSRLGNMTEAERGELAKRTFDKLTNE